MLVRVTPGVEAHTHEYIETGTDDSKFGFTASTTAPRVAAVARIVAERRVSTSPGSTATSARRSSRSTSFARAVDRIVGLVAPIEAATGATVDELNLGGGLGVRYLADDPAPTIAAYARRVRDACAKALADAGVRSRPRLMVEPGRSIAAPAGITLYRVGTIKEIPGVRTYVAVDGGMSDNPRPVTYGARLRGVPPRARRRAAAARRSRVAGKHCEQGDLLVARRATCPPTSRSATCSRRPVTGAYGYSMASNYNKVPRPAVVFVRDGQARVVVRRETVRRSRPARRGPAVDRRCRDSRRREDRRCA